MLLELVVTLVAAGVVGFVVQAIIKHYRLRRLINKIPGWDGLPIVGDALKIDSDPHVWFHRVVGLCKENYDAGIFKLWVGTSPSIYVFRADTAEEFFKSSKHIRKNFFYWFLKPWLGDGLLISSDSKWFARRRLITPTFHFKILEQFVHVFNEQAAVLVSQLDQKAGGPGFDVQPYIYRCMLDVICETAMGVKIDAQRSHDSPYVRTTYSEAELILHRMKYPWLWPTQLFKLFPSGRQQEQNLKILHQFTRQVIAERQQEMKRNVSSDTTTKTKTSDDDADNIYTSAKRRRLAFLDMLLEAARDDPSLTVDGIQEEVDTFMFEGHDTTASGSVWILYMLACFPELQVKVQQEIDAVLGDGNRDVTMDDVNQLKYTDCFIKETLRLYPPVGWFGRETSEECVIGGYRIPAGVSVSPISYVMHRDPAYFPDPEKFDPDRWLDDSVTSRHPYCYVPFSAGLRNCIGQRFAMLEEKVVLSHLVRSFTVTTDSTIADVDTVLTLILKPVVPLMLKFTRRDRRQEI